MTAFDTAAGRWVAGTRRYTRRLSCSLRLRGDAYATQPPPGVEERWINTADGVRIHAWYARASRRATSGSTTLLWAHGNGVSIARRPDVLEALAARGLDVLAFDYRGCGRSTGRPSEAGFYRDAAAAYDSERARGVPPSRIVAFGESLGGVVALDLGTRRPCAGVAVVSTLTHVRDLWPGVGALSRSVRLDALERIQRLHVPVLVAHGDRDQTIRLEIGRRLFAAANPPKAFLRVAGAGHYTVLQNVSLLDALAAFAHEVAGETRRGCLP
jgi:alpha-beta hydrolase superfamily lysophospholipase